MVIILTLKKELAELKNSVVCSIRPHVAVVAQDTKCRQLHPTGPRRVGVYGVPRAVWRGVSSPSRPLSLFATVAPLASARGAPWEGPSGFASGSLAAPRASPFEPGLGYRGPDKGVE